MIILHKFVEFVPDELELGVLYISLNYRTASHLCPCGCGEEVVTPLSPVLWQMWFDGESVSLYPSISNGQSICHSHYWIKKGKVSWSYIQSESEIRLVLQRDRQDAFKHFSSPRDLSNTKDKEEKQNPTPKNSLLSRLSKWLGRY